MRIKVQLPRVESTEPVEPQACPYGCGCEHFKKHGKESQGKSIRDTEHKTVASQRWRCVKCHRTFRTYPSGISQAQQSDRLKAMSILLYVLGLSYGGVSDFLEALGVGIGKTTVYDNAQAAGVISRQRQQQDRARGQAHPVIGSDGTYVKIKGVKVGIQVVVGDSRQDWLGLALTLSENSPEVVSLIEEIAQAVEAEVLISDDLGSYQDVADELGLDHQICRSHVRRNVDAHADEIFEQLKKKEPIPEGVESSPEMLVMDLALLQWLIRHRPAEAVQMLRQLYHRYQAAPKPPPKKKHDVWYRMRMLVTRLWNRWQRLTLDQRRDDLDGTNNASERVIGWWIKERYRTMRGYKRAESVKNIVTLTARMGARSGSYDMAELFA
jgi:transposase-like protein